MNIGLIFPNKDRKDKTIHLGLAYIAAYARKKHPDVLFHVLDTRVARKKEVKEFFEYDFDLIGMTVLSPVYHEVIQLFHHIRKIKPKTPICLGGAYVTTIMEEVFEDTSADFAVYGEGEITFSEIIDHLKGNKELSDINGLMFIQSEEIVINPPREQIKDLDNLPFPAYDLFKMGRYPMHRIVTSRGCPYKCVFCNSSSIWLGKWRKRKPELIIEELNILLKEYGRKPVFFNDNSFNVDLKRVQEFCKLIIQKNIDILWTTPVRAEIIDLPTAKLMKKSGCYNVGIGIESTNTEVLDKIKKKSSLESVQKGVRIFKESGIEVLGQFVIGSIGDTLETVTESIEFAKKSELDFIMFYSILPFKGTQQWDYVNEHGKLYINKIHNYHTASPRIVFETPEFSYADRLKAIELARKWGYYSENNNRSNFFDFGKSVATKTLQYLPSPISNKIYITMKNLYRNRISKI